MVDSDGSTSAPTGGAASNRPPITEADIRSVFPGDEAWAHNWVAMIGADERQRFLEPLGALNDPNVLEGMLTGRRWLDTAKYLDKAIAFHAQDNKVAAAYPDEDAVSPGGGDGMLLRKHPELFVLPRRQHTLDLVADGEKEAARQYYNNSIFAPTRLVRRTRHLDNLIQGLQDMVHGAKPLLNVPEETARDIRDYVRVYFPSFNKTFDVVASMMASNEVLHTTSAFGEVVGGYDYRCLVCHQLLTFHSDPNNRMAQHLHESCPAMTPAVRRRLPPRNRPPWMSVADPTAGPSSASASGGDDGHGDGHAAPNDDS